MPWGYISPEYSVPKGRKKNILPFSDSPLRTNIDRESYLEGIQQPSPAQHSRNQRIEHGTLAFAQKGYGPTGTDYADFCG